VDARDKRGHDRKTKSPANRRAFSGEQIAMPPRTDQKYFFICNGIDQEPIRLDVAFPNAAPFAGRFVRTIGGWQRALLGKEFNHGNKVGDILAAALLAPEIIAKLSTLRNSPHGAA